MGWIAAILYQVRANCHMNISKMDLKTVNLTRDTFVDNHLMFDISIIHKEMTDADRVSKKRRQRHLIVKFCTVLLILTQETK